MLRAHKGQQKVPILKKTTGLCSSIEVVTLRSYLMKGPDITFLTEWAHCHAERMVNLQL